MTKVKEYNAICPSTVSYPFPLVISEEGILVQIFAMVPTRCEADLYEKVLDIVGDRTKAAQIIRLFNKEFSGIMTDYRVKGKILNKNLKLCSFDLTKLGSFDSRNMEF